MSDPHLFFSDEKVQRFWYQCKTCKFMVYFVNKPTKRDCLGCRNPEWELLENQIDTESDMMEVIIHD
jgi:hypothetical protein